MHTVPRFVGIIFWILFGVLALAYGLEFIVYWSASIPWVDMPLHALGGMWASFLFFILFLHLFDETLLAHAWEKAKIAIVAVSFAALVGILWEFHEYIFAQYFSLYLQPGVRDTLGDFFWDILGGALGAWIVLRRIRPLSYSGQNEEEVQNQNLPL